MVALILPEQTIDLTSCANSSPIAFADATAGDRDDVVIENFICKDSCHSVLARFSIGFSGSHPSDELLNLIAKANPRDRQLLTEKRM